MRRYRIRRLAWLLGWGLFCVSRGWAATVSNPPLLTFVEANGGTLTQQVQFVVNNATSHTLDIYATMTLSPSNSNKYILSTGLQIGGVWYWRPTPGNQWAGWPQGTLSVSNVYMTTITVNTGTYTFTEKPVFGDSSDWRQPAQGTSFSVDWGADVPPGSPSCTMNWCVSDSSNPSSPKLGFNFSFVVQPNGARITSAVMTFPAGNTTIKTNNYSPGTYSDYEQITGVAGATNGANTWRVVLTDSNNTQWTFNQSFTCDFDHLPETNQWQNGGAQPPASGIFSLTELANQVLSWFSPSSSSQNAWKGMMTNLQTMGPLQELAAIQAAFGYANSQPWWSPVYAPRKWQVLSPKTNYDANEPRPAMDRGPFGNAGGIDIDLNPDWGLSLAPDSWSMTNEVWYHTGQVGGQNSMSTIWHILRVMEGWMVWGTFAVSFLLYLKGRITV